ncbi:MAG TPA: DNA repair protein RecN [Acidobacteriota bacterium]|nr:DNA repair protein RecN [Acidobacteriota bacterium]
MLKFLTIENFALIERLEVEFQAGLNLVTGETGSGKSILVDAVGLLAGGRAAQDMVRQGFEKAQVEGLFELQEGHPAWRHLKEAGLEGDEGQLLVRREIALSGTNKVFINGRLATAGLLGEVGNSLVDIHGQHDQQQLLQPSNHLEFLDAFAEQPALLSAVSERYREWTEVKDKIRHLREGEQDRLQRLDTLQFQAQELEKLSLSRGLDQELEEERRLLSTAEKRLAHSSQAFQILYEQEGSAMELLGKVSRNLQDLAEADPALTDSASKLDELRFQMEEVAFRLRDYSDGIEFNPDRQEAVEQRLAELQRAMRKYGKGVEELIEYAAGIGPEIEELEHGEERAEELEAREKDLSARYMEAAEQLSQGRRKASRKLAKAVEKELADLAMNKTVFRVSIESDEELASPRGFDRVEFLISPNPGEEPRPLVKIASGGELSRIILALKSVLTLEPYSKTLVFDEVDSGVGGRVASSIGDKLAALGRHHQVFCVTHLPQVACYAARHLQVGKQTRKGRTTVHIGVLREDERVEELSRMLSGETVTEATRQHARDLLERAHQQEAGTGVG